jgi:tyrosinase
MRISRRTVLTGTASLTVLSGVPLGLLSARRASGAGPVVRYDARSAEGKAMLRLYAKAVTEMRKPAVKGTPSDWTFQWYSHAVSGLTNKDAELRRMYPNANDPNRLLADLTWDTCESHFSDNDFNFLPWHRAFVLLFEEIARNACQDESFSLPYWDYTSNAALPEEFRKKDDPVFGVLFVDRRYRDVNAGTPIDQRSGVQMLDRMNLDSLKEGSFLAGPDGIPPGMNNKLDGDLHGFVHVNVGTPQNMGRVPNAAYDPIFWLHHCNIDRIWASWNDHGNQNPASDTWKGQTHVFADVSGNRREITNGEVTDLTPLGYSYDKLLPKPAPAAIVVAAAPRSEGATAAMPDQTLATSDKKLSLGNKALSVQLQPKEAPAAAQALARRLTDTTKTRWLVIRDIATNVEPGVVYDVFARPAGEKSAEPSDKLYIGSINFFNSERREGQPPRDVKFVFNLTEKLAGKGDVDPLNYFIVPAGSPEADAQPVVGKIELIDR